MNARKRDLKLFSQVFYVNFTLSECTKIRKHEKKSYEKAEA